jgi:hypothetical protein
MTQKRIHRFGGKTERKEPPGRFGVEGRVILERFLQK